MTPGWIPRPLAFALDGPPAHIHVLAVGGAGMSAVAEVLLALGHTVSGSDRSDSVALVRLRSLGAAVWTGHDVERMADVGHIDAVISSTAIQPDNVELVAARSNGVAIHHRGDVLAGIGGIRRVVSVSGTHGKTTTSTLTALALDGAGFDPGFIIGGDVGGTGVGSGARWSSSPWFVLEGDESDSTFLAPRRSVAIVTNLEADHLDHHGTPEALVASFERFVTATDGPVVLCVDDPGAAALGAAAEAAGRPVVRYGVGIDSDLRVTDVDLSADGSRWTLSMRSGQPMELTLPIPGRHLVSNATAAMAASIAIGADPASAAAGLTRYRGVGRRYERRGEAGGVTFIDDYAHLPAEIDTVIDAARAEGWSRVVAVFQPHGFSRTIANAARFGRSLAAADEVVVTDVYPARDEPVPGVSGRLVVDAVRAQGRSTPVHDAPTFDEAVDVLVAVLRPGDLCLTLGAGDLTKLPDMAIRRMSGP